MRWYFFVYLSLITTTLFGCAKSKDHSERPPIAIVNSSEKFSNGTVELVEPRYLLNGQYVKLWANGEPFFKLQGGSFAVHASGICVLVLGPNWVYESYVPSSTVATGEIGAIVSNVDGVQVHLIGRYEFKPADRTPIRFSDGSVYWPKESNFWISKLSCWYRKP